jgi:hypothetical protein
MSEHKDEKWLDGQLQRAVDGATPVFDAQAWKQKYANEYEALLARGRQTAGWGLPYRAIRILGGPFGKIAVAAVIAVAAGVLLVGRSGLPPERPTPDPQPIAQQSPAQMVSMLSLSAAFRRGGIDELDKQCDRALETLGPRPNSVSVQELLKDINGKG